MMKLCVVGMLITALLSPVSAQTPMFIGPGGPVDLRDHDLMYAADYCPEPGCVMTYRQLLQARKDVRTFCTQKDGFLSDRERDASHLLCMQVRTILDVDADVMTNSVFRSPSALNN